MCAFASPHAPGAWFQANSPPALQLGRAACAISSAADSILFERAAPFRFSQGGAISLSSGAGLLLEASSFSGNAALRGSGAALALVGTPLSSNGCLFDSNSALGEMGGAISVQNAPQMSLSGCTLRHNVAQGLNGRGGAIAAINVTSVELSGCQLSHNTVSSPPTTSGSRVMDQPPPSIGQRGRPSVSEAADAGAAAAAAADAAPSVYPPEGNGEDVVARFRAGDAGALFIMRSPGQPPAAVTLSACLIQYNRALASGGGLSLFGPLRVSVRCLQGDLRRSLLLCPAAPPHREHRASRRSFRKITPLRPYVPLLCCSSQVSNTTISFNNATFGGGAVVAGLGAQLAFVGGSLSGNSAAVAYAGAAAASSDPAAAGTGGALWLGAGVEASAAGTDIRGNVAGGSGGAASLRSSSRLDVSDCAVTGNSARSGGGAFALQGRAGLSITRSAVNANSAFLGGVVAFTDVASARSAAVSLSALSLANNTATAGSLWALMQGDAQLAEPVCADCVQTLVAPLSYGATFATPPSRSEVTLTGFARHGLAPGQIRPGEPLAVVISAHHQSHHSNHF